VLNPLGKKFGVLSSGNGCIFKHNAYNYCNSKTLIP